MNGSMWIKKVCKNGILINSVLFINLPSGGFLCLKGKILTDFLSYNRVDVQYPAAGALYLII